MIIKSFVNQYSLQNILRLPMLKTHNKKAIPSKEYSTNDQKQQKHYRSHKKMFYKEKDEQETIATLSHYGDEYIREFEQVEQNTVSITVCGYQFNVNCYSIQEVTSLLQWVDTIPQLLSHKIQTKLILLSNLSTQNPNLSTLLDSLCQQYSETQTNKLFNQSGN